MKYSDGQFFTTEKISRRLEKTPEGFLLCRDVPISRTGTFDYSPIEGGIPAGSDGLVHLSRNAEDLFSEDTMKSFEGKPVVIGHSSFVDPKNWKDRSIGIAQNIRRGEGDNADKLLADLLITDQHGIDLVESEDMREISCGYDAEPIDEGGGNGKQVGIVGNHIALVQKGRCGSACRIRDGAMSTNLKTLLRRVFRDGDEEKFNEALDDLKIEKVEEVEEKPEEKPEEKAPEKTIEERLDELEALVKGLVEKAAEKVEDAECEKPVADEDPKPEAEVEEKTEEKTEEVKVEDEDAVEVKDEDARACMDEAEEVCPGMKKPTADSADGHFTVGTLKRVKRMALKGANVTAFGDASTLDGVALDTAFKAAVLMARAAKNPAPAKVQKFGDSSLKARPSNAELNSLYNNFWKRS